MKVHELKTWPQFYQAVIDGTKTFEYRLNDRKFQVGDILRLKEYVPEAEQYTGRSIEMFVTYILSHKDFDGIPKGYVIMSIVEA